MKISMLTVVGEWWEGRKFKHPQTGHMVLFKSLPLEEQKRLNDLIKKDDEEVKPQQQKPNEVVQQKPNEVLQDAKQEITKEVSTAIEQATGEALPGKARLVVKEIVSSAAGPFVFGFLDNFIMLVAGASIDSALGSLGFGATALAGIGNTISDTVSKASEESLDNLMDKVGFTESKEGQALTSKEKKVIRSLGGIAGITMGCIAGMIPMLFGVKLGAKKKAQEDTPDFETMLSIVQKKVGVEKFKEVFKHVIAKVGSALDRVLKEKALNQASAYVDKAKGIITSVGKEKALKTLYEQIRDY